MRRYFRQCTRQAPRRQLFSAHAEVFPCKLHFVHGFCSLLRACGGISSIACWAACPPLSSPRMRRYFLLYRRRSQARRLFSAHAEVFPRRRNRMTLFFALLRACGGISYEGAAKKLMTASSPRMRRYFLRLHSRNRENLLFSAHAEVFPDLTSRPYTQKSLLRACGGISLSHCLRVLELSSSPRMRRYFRFFRHALRGTVLFSAHAEVFPKSALVYPESAPLLRACGGISTGLGSSFMREISSPRMRRYFRGDPAQHPAGGLFSAHAEVFPFVSYARATLTTLLRACGGISVCVVCASHLNYSSPRMRRYFLPRLPHRRTPILFSAHAEVFPSKPTAIRRLESLLRACGGISEYHGSDLYSANSSPRMRRYFRAQSLETRHKTLFSAHAEVFPRKMIVATIVGTLLRACGDISRYGAWHRLSGDSSPRMRRYFRDSGGGSGHEILFSAHAEVFPPAMWMIRECGSLLRACGGISEP